MLLLRLIGAYGVILVPDRKLQPQQISREKLNSRFTVQEKEDFYKMIHGDPVPPGPPPSQDDSIRVLRFLAYLSRPYLFVDDPLLLEELEFLVTFGVLQPGRPAILLAI